MKETFKSVKRDHLTKAFRTAVAIEAFTEGQKILPDGGQTKEGGHNA